MSLLFVNMIFKKFKLNNVTLNNRIVISPMCQYSSVNGSPSKWHYQHLGKLAISGAGMLMIESTSINKVGKITHKDMCLYNNQHEKNFNKLIKYLKTISNIPIGLQISHSGRKGSANVPWLKTNVPLNTKQKKWQTLAPSPLKKDKNWPVPKEMNFKQINKLKNDYRNCALRAKRIGLECLEIHMAHGYLLHEFFSPISNIRKDKYGGNLKNRAKLLIEIGSIVRKIWPKDKILGARVTATDHMQKGINISDSIYLVKELKKIGFDYVCISSGGIKSKTKLRSYKGFRVNLAEKIKKSSKIKVRTSGLLNDLNFMKKIISQEKCDFVAVGRKFLLNPNWLQNSRTKYKFKVPNQYLRGIN